MRVISGKFRGRRLVQFKADHIRPTTDRIKESVFNKLQGAVDSSRVLDLFSGTGNLTCEAVSRGAASVDAVELSKKSIAIIRENLKLLDIENDVRVINEDVLKYLRRYEGEPYDLIFADPPFTEKLADQVLVEASKSKAIGPDTLLVLESSSHEFLAETYEGLSCDDRRDYGDKIVSYWRRS
ncbi:MAG TPA: 16S rRNA (guanine(966)-N(2))-methyltransferase RsmD [Bdellovibrionales bacterium]|nr:16S rRNA (guanine(966)-N(2))-methyltransferase RsmD [Bdellovibrionales bacterium]